MTATARINVAGRAVMVEMRLANRVNVEASVVGMADG
jgi:hypothetical protein